MEFFKKRKVQVILGVIVALVLLIGGYFLFVRSQTPVEEETDEFVIPISAAELGLSMEANEEGNEIKFFIDKATDITSVEYQLTYEADSTAAEQAEGGEPRVQRGITGEEQLDGEASFESEWLVLGSESAGVVRYDKGVESVTLTLKITKKDGKIYEAEDTLEL